MSTLLEQTKGRGYEPCDDIIDVRVAWLSIDPEDRTQPDIDNMLKPLIDVMNGRIFVDDRQVHRILAEKADLNFWPASLDVERDEIQDDPDYGRFGEVVIIRADLLVEERER